MILKQLFKHSILLFIVTVWYALSGYFGKVAKLLSVKAAYADVADTIPFDSAVKTGIIEQRINIDYSEMIYKDRTHIAPLTFLMDSLKSKPAKTTVVKGFEQRSAPQTVKMNGDVTTDTGGGAIAAGDMIDVVLDSGEYKNVQVGMLVEFLYTPSSASYTQYGRVYSKPASDTIRVEPNDSTKILSKSANLIPDDTVIWLLGSSYDQFSNSVEPVTVMPNPIENVTQIIRTPYALSRSAAKENMYGEGERNRLMEYARFNHLVEIEKAILFNGPAVTIKQTSSNTVHRGTMRGMEHWILNDSPKNYQYDGTNPFITDHDVWVNNLFDPLLVTESTQYIKFGLINRGYQMFWDKAIKEHPGTKIYDAAGAGIKYGFGGVKRLESGFGTIDLYVHPLFNARYSDLNAPACMALHLKYLEMRVFLKTMLKANIQNNDADGLKDEFITEITWLGYLPELHGMIRKTPTY